METRINMKNPIETVTEKLALDYAERIEEACLEHLPAWASRAYRWHPWLRDPALRLAAWRAKLSLSTDLDPSYVYVEIDGKRVAKVYRPCPLDICDGSGVTVENAGCCGGCDRCGSREEKEVTCPCKL